MKPAPNPHRENYIAGLDGLRGLAALAVFGVHFNQIVRLDSRWGPFNIEMLLANGNHAVSLFFSLSGFLLSLPYWKAMVDHRPFPDVRTYLLRRTARILPAYYVALTALIIIGALWRIPDARADILLHYIFLFNFAEFSIFSINPPFWTLAVEIQFYLLLPCIFLLINKSSPHKPLQFITVVAVGSYGLQYLLMGSVSRIIPWPFNPWLTWIRPHGAVLSHSILANLPIFLIGVAAAKLYLDLKRNGSAANPVSGKTADSIFWICFLAVFLLLTTGYVQNIGAPRSPFAFPVVPTLLTAMIFTAPMTHVAKRILDGVILRKLGAISYGIYIYHLPCLNVVDRQMSAFGLDADKHWLIFGLAGLGLSILISIASFVAVEKPIMRLVRKI